MITSLLVFFVSTAVLVYLNYKNAYEHWNEQRLALNKEVRIFGVGTTRQVICNSYGDVFFCSPATHNFSFSRPKAWLTIKGISVLKRSQSLVNETLFHSSKKAVYDCYIFHTIIMRLILNFMPHILN